MLDQATADRLFSERYYDQLERDARKNAYLSDFKDPEDLFQDMIIHVWMKAVNNFDTTRTTTGHDLERQFNQFFHTILSQYKASLAAHRQTGKQQHLDKNTSLDRNVGGDGEEGATFLDLVEGGEVDTASVELNSMIEKLPQELGEAVTYLIQHSGPGATTEVFKEIRDKWGFTKHRMIRDLMEEPEFVDYATAI